MKRNLISLCLALSLTAVPSLTAGSALAAGLEEQFPAIQEYPGYADVRESDWFSPYAVLCYETGLITGSGAGFEPYRQMTVGEAAAMAARLREAVTGDPIPFATPRPGETLPWYFSYINYLTSHGVTGLDRPEDAATRTLFLGLLAAVLPERLLAPINAIPSLPDTDNPDVLTFYRAGILTGTDRYGTFRGENPLTRSEGAAMVSRVVRETLRSSFTPADYTLFSASGLTPGDVLFRSGGIAVTAEDYLPAALALIQELEQACADQGLTFNWFNTYGEETFLDYVKSSAMAGLGVTPEMAAAAWERLDLQVFYSRYLDLTQT